MNWRGDKMTEREMRDLFGKHDEHYHRFNDVAVEKRHSNRPDLHAFILLDKLVPSEQDIVWGSEHDEICLNVNLEKLAAVISEEEIIELVRCGVRCSYEGLSMFV